MSLSFIEAVADAKLQKSSGRVEIEASARALLFLVLLAEGIVKPAACARIERSGGSSPKALF